MQTSCVRQGMITVIFHSGSKGAAPALRSIQSEFCEIIRASFRVQLDGDTHLEIIMVRGDGDLIRNLEQQIITRRGIRSARFSPIQ